MAINDQPCVSDIEQLISFCGRYREIFVYGCSEPQELFVKFFRSAGVSVSGYVISDGHQKRQARFGLPVLTVSELLAREEEDFGIVLSVPGCYYNEILCQMQQRGFGDFRRLFFVNDQMMRTIPHKMRARTKDRFWLEVNLADHCNLNCQMCDHFAPIAEKTFMDLKTYTSDMERLAKLMDHEMGIMKLQGGEPLLNDQLIDYIKATRNLFPRCKLWIFTDGILLPQWEHHKMGNLWQICHDYNVEIQLTVYPIALDYERIRKMGAAYDVKISAFFEVADRNFGKDGIKKSVKHPFDLEGKVEPYRYISCYQLNEAIVLNNGRIYTCPMIPYVHHFNKFFNQNLEVSPEDSIDIYQAKSYEEIAEFVASRVPFCRYCMVHERRQFDWKQSEHVLEEWTL